MTASLFDLFTDANARTDRDFYCRCGAKVEETVNAAASKRGQVNLSTFFCPSCKLTLSYIQLFRKPR